MSIENYFQFVNTFFATFFQQVLEACVFNGFISKLFYTFLVTFKEIGS